PSRERAPDRAALRSRESGTQPRRLEELHVQPDAREVARAERLPLDTPVEDAAPGPIHLRLVRTADLEQQAPAPRGLSLDLAPPGRVRHQRRVGDPARRDLATGEGGPAEVVRVA